MTTGIIVLIATGLVIYFGMAQRALDHLYLTDNTALLVVVLLIIGSFIEFTIISDPLLTINIGGALIPLILAVYVISKIDTSKEIYRTIAAVILTTAAIYGISMLFRNFGHGRDIIDPMYLYAVIGGIIAYALGRSRRGSFVAGTMGFLFYNLINFFRVLRGSLVSEVRLGGAGAFDSIVISGLIALLMAELIGESCERLQGGDSWEDNQEGNYNEE